MMSEDYALDREAKVRAYEDVLKSRTLARSEQLVRFLRYICDLEVEGRGAEITEYSIATAALHRPTDYSPGEDSSVRSRAHALRRKLHEYYESEAPDAEIRIELPKGSYRPVFHSRLQTDAPLEVAPPEPAPTTATGKFRLIATALALAAVAGIIAWRVWPGSDADALIREAWGPVLRPGSEVMLMISAPPMLRLAPSQPGVAPASTVNDAAPVWATDWYRGLGLADRGGPLYVATSRGYSVFSDLLGAMSISSLLTTHGASWHAVPENVLPPRAIHENALIVIGAPSYTAYLTRILKSTPYSIWFEPTLNDEVMGRRGAPAAELYTPKRDAPKGRYSTVYGLITVLPGQPGHPRPERTLIFAGFAGSPGAQGAIDYFRSSAALEDLAKRFRQEGQKGFPPAYQVIVRCGVDGETAISAVYEKHVVMRTPPVIE